LTLRTISISDGEIYTRFCFQEAFRSQLNNVHAPQMSRILQGVIVAKIRCNVFHYLKQINSYKCFLCESEASASNVFCSESKAL